MKIKNIALSFALFALASTAFAETQYSAIVDAGSTGSRLHLFKYDNAKSVPVIEDIYSEKVSPGLSSFASHPQDVGKTMQPMFEHLVQKLATLSVDQQQVNVKVFATAGMRSLPDNIQKSIYDNLKTVLKGYRFRIKNIDEDVKTISGKEESLYGWLDVNYLEGNLQKHTPTVGSLDMGGASTQIAFETQDVSRAEDLTTLSIDGQKYIVFSQSFLGLGQDQSRADMNKNSNFEKCYPVDSPIQGSKGKFDFNGCRDIYTQIISDKKVKENILPTTNQKFVAYSGAFYAYNFFEVLQATDQNRVESRIQEYCQVNNEQKPIHDWTWWQDTFKKEPPALLLNYCANATYISHLFYNFYQIKGDSLQVTDKINQQGLDWTLGAMLYQLVD